ncbi:MAG: HypC/HybG/HupF family hydrogenase formation chaperone [Proteobacteria bacterium]|nr:HypC/HybG/HupF family hydrogenase formation chaperone [Pseudomonadota bacterium]
MCIGWPMQVIAARAGFAQVRRGAQQRVVGTALVGAVQPGDWLLVFLDDARERLAPERAAEIDATLALVEAALGGEASAGGAAPFELPSAIGADQLRNFVR